MNSTLGICEFWNKPHIKDCVRDAPCKNWVPIVVEENKKQEITEEESQNEMERRTR